MIRNVNNNLTNLKKKCKLFDLHGLEYKLGPVSTFNFIKGDYVSSVITLYPSIV